MSERCRSEIASRNRPVSFSLCAVDFFFDPGVDPPALGQVTVAGLGEKGDEGEGHPRIAQAAKAASGRSVLLPAS